MSKSELRDEMDGIKERIRLMCRRPNRLTIDNIEKRLDEIEMVLNHVDLLEEGRKFRDLLLLYQAFLKMIYLFMLEYGKRHSRLSIEDFPSVIIKELGQLIRFHHYQSGYLCTRIDPPIINNLEYKVQKVIINSDPSKELPTYDTEILVTVNTVEEFKQFILERLKTKGELFFSFEKLQNEELLKQHVILSVLCNLPNDMILVQIMNGFKVIARETISQPDKETTIYKVSES